MKLINIILYVLKKIKKFFLINLINLVQKSYNFKMPEIKIIYEDENFLAIDKPSGLMVHPARVSANKKNREAEPTLIDWLLSKYPEIKNVGDDPATRPGIVHRLDKETSGVLLIPKNQKYFEYLKSLFQEHLIQKKYYAVVFGIPKNQSGVIDVPIGIKNGTLKRSIHSGKMAKTAVTEYKQLKTKKLFDKYGKEYFFSYLDVSPKTGRTHQIRVHLASIGHPIVGDTLYGAKKQQKLASVFFDNFPNEKPRLMLHSYSLEFAPYPNKSLKIETDTPDIFL